MIDASIGSWLLFLLYFILASISGITFSSLLPWTSSARKAKVAFYWGLSIAPFVLGLLGVICLKLFPGSSSLTHHIFLISTLVIISVSGWLTKKLNIILNESSKSLSLNKYETCAVIILVFGITSLLFNMIFMPLTQNDALEYATVGRVLFEYRDLAVYPLIDPLLSKSGFYGPWTHPPLYVVLFYISNIIQGHADTPGLIRLISPWFAISSVGLIYSTGVLLRNRYAGLLSAAIMISTPLFFLGADSALIDPLPISGFVLVFVLLFSLSTSNINLYSLAIGTTLGISMWTHSQAILFPILTICVFALKNIKLEIRKHILQLGLVLLSMGLVAFWPYLYNYFLFGSPISDNPTVFAFEKLNWVEYFEIARGFYSISDKIQYGVFKGWFMLESYAFTYWLMTLGAISYFKYVKFNLNKNNLEFNGFDLSLILIIMYTSGVVASLLIGTDLMIKNERYLLIMLPFVSLIAGIGISHLHTVLVKKVSGRFLLGLFLVLLFLQVLSLNAYRLITLQLRPSEILTPQAEKIKKLPNLLAIDYLKTQTPPDAIILSMRPSDMYYADRTMISYLDPRLLPFYKESDYQKAYQHLLDLNIKYILIPNYTIPPMYNSALKDIVNDSTMTQLLFSQSGHQIYRLLKIPSKHQPTSTVNYDKNSWKVEYRVAIMGRKGLFKALLSAKEINSLEALANDSYLSFIDRSLTKTIWSTYIPIEEFKSDSDKREISVNINLEGSGFARVLIRCLGYKSKPIIYFGQEIKPLILPIAEILLERSNTYTIFSKRLFLENKDIACQFGIEHSTSNDIILRELTMSTLGNYE